MKDTQLKTMKKKGPVNKANLQAGNKTTVEAFINSPENIELIRRNQKYTAQINSYIKENISVEQKVLAQPFTI